jgi:hypothetical protein
MSFDKVKYQKEYVAKHYLKNKEIYKNRARENTQKYRIRNRKFVNSIKEQQQCCDCSGKFIACQLDFDHISENKERNVSKLVNVGASLSKILKEIEKCDVVCANCHRLRTYKRLSPAAGNR